MFQRMFPILTVRDLPAALGFYRDLLGFRQTYQFPAEGPPTYVSLRLGDSGLGLGQDARAAERPDGPYPFELWIYADDCDAAVERLRAAGVQVLSEPHDQPWGERMARVADPEGNRITIGSTPVRSAPAPPPTG